MTAMFLFQNYLRLNVPINWVLIDEKSAFRKVSTSHSMLNEVNQPQLLIHSITLTSPNCWPDCHSAAGPTHS